MERLERSEARRGVIDCNQSLTQADIVPGEVHPNGVVHRRWAECVAAAFAEPGRLPPPKGAGPG